MTESKEVALLLIGKTGTGKSSTGNSILRRKAFKSNCTATSVTVEIRSEVSEFDNRYIKVVDSPGVGDNRLSKENATRMMLKQMINAIAINPQGYHAFLLVVKFGERFTAEDQDTIDFLKKIFGQNFVKNFCILLMTRGDNFEYEYAGKKTFQQWYEEQQGQFKDLIKECDNRVVLFDNRTPDKEKKNKQIENLLSVVDSLNSRGRRYTDHNFESAKRARDRIMVELKRSVIQDGTMRETSLILLKLQELRKKPDLKTKVEALEILQARIESLLREISAEDQRTGALRDLYENIESINKNVTDDIVLCKRRIKEIKLFQRVVEETEKARRQENETRRKHQEEVKLLKEQHTEQVIEERRKVQKEQERQRRKMEENAKVKIKETEEKFKPKQAQLEIRYVEIEKHYITVRENNDTNIVGKVLACAALMLLPLALSVCIIS